jgi:mono/diheme cytochrome c family protein
MRTDTRYLFALAAPLCLGGLLLAQHTLESDTNPLAGNGAAIAAGNRTYDSACQSCHGAGARGDRGPALATGLFRHGNADGQIFRSKPANLAV